MSLLLMETKELRSTRYSDSVKSTKKIVGKTRKMTISFIDKSGSVWYAIFISSISKRYANHDLRSYSNDTVYQKPQEKEGLHAC